MLPPRGPAKIDPDDAIRATDDDAAASRLSAINLGYLSDPYTALLYKPPRPPPGQSPLPSRKPPLINVGTHHRTYAIDRLVDSFLASVNSVDPSGLSGTEGSNGSAGGSRQVQIVSLGAGSDSRYWRLRSGHNAHRVKRYIEVDFPHVTSTKAQRVSRSPKLSAALAEPSSSTQASSPPSLFSAAHNSISAPALTPPSSPSSSSSALPPPPETTRPSGTSNPQPSSSSSMPPPAPPSKPYTILKGGTALKSDSYILLPLDLRPNPSATLQAELLPLLDPSLPTLFLAECVFCYMQPKLSEEIIRWFGGTFGDVVGVVYEMCGLTDTFGQVMRRNLAARHLSIPGSDPFPTVASQAERFMTDRLGSGKFGQSGAMSLWDVRERVIPNEELQRISRLEMLDEIEELRLVLSHYCVAWGTKGEVVARVSL